jgi:hypothetical protein
MHRKVEANAFNTQGLRRPASLTKNPGAMAGVFHTF